MYFACASFARYPSDGFSSRNYFEYYDPENEESYDQLEHASSWNPFIPRALEFIPFKLMAPELSLSKDDDRYTIDSAIDESANSGNPDAARSSYDPEDKNSKCIDFSWFEEDESSDYEDSDAFPIEHVYEEFESRSIIPTSPSLENDDNEIDGEEIVYNIALM